jgi:hypothetical protein
MRILIDRQGGMLVLPPEQPIRDTHAWQKVKQVLEESMLPWKPAMYQGRIVKDIMYLLLDTEAIADACKKRRG